MKRTENDFLELQEFNWYKNTNLIQKRMEYKELEIKTADSNKKRKK